MNINNVAERGRHLLVLAFIFAVTAALVVVAPTTPRAQAQTGQGSTSGGSNFAASDASRYSSGARGDAVIMRLSVFGSGNWKKKPGDNTPSPAWNDFVNSTVSDFNGEDAITTLVKHQGFTETQIQQCKASSIIWIAENKALRGQRRDRLPSPNGLGPFNINFFTPLASLAGSVGSKQIALQQAENVNRKDANDLAGAAEYVVKNEALDSKKKIICSYQYDLVKADDGTKPNTPPPPQNPGCLENDSSCWETPNPDTDNSVCENDKWHYGRSPELAASLRGYSALFNGLSVIAAAVGTAFIPKTFEWRCITKYEVYYKSAETDYRTENELAQIKDDNTGKIYYSAYQAARESDNFKTNSKLAQVWWDTMGILNVSAASGLSNEFLKRPDIKETHYGSEWNRLSRNPISKNEQDRQINALKSAINKDKTAELSTNTNVPLDMQAVLASGGVMNATEKSRIGIVRYVRPVRYLQIGKYIPVYRDGRDFVPNLLKTMGKTRVASQKWGTSKYKSERPDVSLTRPSEITLDQIKYMTNRIANSPDSTLSEKGRAIVGAGRVALRDGKTCVTGSYSRLAEQQLEFIKLFSGGDLYGTVKTVMKYAKGEGGNVLIPCQKMLESLNMEPGVGEIFSDVADVGEMTAWLATPGKEAKMFPLVTDRDKTVTQRATFAPEVSSWWQVLSVNCNQSGFRNELSKPGVEVVSNAIDVGDKYVTSIAGDAFHGVARSKITQVDYSKKNTLYNKSNFTFARPGTPTYMRSFYDKECPFACTSDPQSLGASDENDAKNNVVLKNGKRNAIGQKDGFGAQMDIDPNNMKPNATSAGAIANSQLFNIFRDNEWRDIRVNVWFPSNGVDLVAAGVNELESIDPSDIRGAIRHLGDAGNELLRNAGNSGSAAILYDGSAPTSTTILRAKDGTPEIGDMFQVRALKGAFGSVSGLSRGSMDGRKDRYEEIMKPSSSGTPPTQRALSQDLPINAGSSKYAMFDGLANGLSVRSKWASDKSKPQVFNFKWEYQTPSAFLSVVNTGFSRKGTQDKNVGRLQAKGAAFTVIEGKCYSMFNTHLGKNTITLFGQYTGTGVPNKLDETTITNNLTQEEKENLLVNSVRSTGE